MWPDCVFNFWPFTANIFPKAYKLCQSKLKTLPKTKLTLDVLPKIFKYFAKSVEFHQIWSHWLLASSERKWKVDKLIFQKPSNARHQQGVGWDRRQERFRSLLQRQSRDGTKLIKLYIFASSNSVLPIFRATSADISDNSRTKIKDLT